MAAPRAASAPPAASPSGGPRPAAPAADAAPAGTGPTPEQRKRFLDQVKDDPEQFERRKGFLQRIDQRDPAALERWQRMMERRQGQGDGPGQGQGQGRGSGQGGAVGPASAQ